jgi:thioredoxin 1
MKTTIIIMAILFFVGYANTTPANERASDTSHGLSFHEGSWDEALQIAKEENKLIFLDIYASWCGPCKRLKENTFTDREAGNLYNANFINMALDGEKGEGKILAQKYGVKAYPTLLFIDHSGRVVTEVKGFHNPRQFVELGKKVLNQQ